MAERPSGYHVPQVERIRFPRERWVHIFVLSASLLSQIYCFANISNGDLASDKSYILTATQMSLVMGGLYLTLLLTVIMRVSLYLPIIVMLAFNIYQFQASVGFIEDFANQGNVMSISLLSCIGYAGLFVYRFTSETT